ncbi:MAG: UvrD-helicase domain-containing protein [Bacteroidetes bacterium]|nr:UvrD-helicase domain-containing protein [Bacteroidota bacterium]
MSELNPEQQMAAKFRDGVCAVIAVPGSGKTKTMMERIGVLVNEHGISPENILGLTFTRNAADEMKNRLIPVLGDLSSRVFLATIHSFCHTVLRSEGHVFDILYGKEQLIFVKDVMKKLKIKDVTIGSALGEISLAKNNLITVDEFKDLYVGDKTMLKIADVFDSYDKEKSNRMLYDFDDLLCKTYELLKENEGVREKYREIFKHLLVDEYQDINPAQMGILKLLIGNSNDGNGSSFWITGDDSQSIYGFLGASVGNIINFKTLFPESEQFILNLNYRSTPQILKACQNLIQHNIRQIHKTLETHNPDGEDVIVLESSSEETEALSLVNEITDLVERQNYTHKQIAILYRCNFQSRVIEEAFLQHKIPYHIQNGLSFYDRREVKILLDYLRVISNPDSDAGDEALETIINVPNRYIGRKFIQEIKQFAFKRDWYLYTALQSMPIKLTYLRKNVKEFVNFMDPLIEDAENLEPAELINLLRASLDIDRYVTDEDIPSPDDVKIYNLNQLQLAASRYNSIEAFLKYTETFQNEAISDNKDGVSLMTIHKAKGLEFPAVFLIGMVEGIMPTKKTENMEEERRICFVAISRAMNLLYLSHSLTYLGQSARKSIFLEEILDEKESKAAA